MAQWLTETRFCQELAFTGAAPALAAAAWPAGTLGSSLSVHLRRPHLAALAQVRTPAETRDPVELASSPARTGKVTIDLCFAGLANFSRQFVRRFAASAAPLVAPLSICDPQRSEGSFRVATGPAGSGHLGRDQARSPASPPLDADHAVAWPAVRVRYRGPPIRPPNALSHQGRPPPPR